MTRVVVAGAGIGGLTLGIALARAGVEVDLYEQADELREVGAAVALSANGTRELYRLGVGEALDAVSTQPTELIYRDGRSGARIAAHPGADAYRERFGAPYWGVHRVDLQQTLAGAFTAAAGEERLHLGRAVTAVDAEAGTLTLAGATEHADRGTWSRATSSSAPTACTRRCATPSPDPARGPSTRAPAPSAASCPSTRCRACPTRTRSSSGPGRAPTSCTTRWVATTTPSTSSPCSAARPTWEGGNRPAAEDELLDGFAGWHPAVREMLAAVPQSPRWPLLSQPPLTRWTRGRTVLIGDAVHAMLPHHGQGANQSIEDAVTLARLLVHRDPADALAAYPRLRRARTRAVAASAWETGTLLHLADDHPRIAERDKRFAGYATDNAWVHDHDVADPSTTTLKRTR